MCMSDRQGMKTIFKNQGAADICEKQGCVALPLLRADEVQALRQVIDDYNIQDRNTYSTETLPRDVGAERTRELRLEITRAVSPALDRLMCDFKVVTAGFVIKKPDAKSFIPPHQDCTYTDEEVGVHETFVCWIPLVDTSVENGTIGAIIGSHRVLDAPSPPFPNPRVPRYHDENVFDLFSLMTYFDLAAGEAFIFNSRTLHGSLPNRSKDERPAIRLGLVHRDAQICHYFLKPGSSKQRMLKYSVDAEFYDAYSNERLVQIYDEGLRIEGYPMKDECAYYIDTYSTSELRAQLSGGGSENNPLS